MTSRQARQERREAERKLRKEEYRLTKAASAAAPMECSAAVSANSFEPTHHTGSSPDRDEIVPPTRTAINRANAQHSTGPTSPDGKLASSRNSTKHGLSTGVLLIPGEDPAEYNASLAALLAQYQPTNPIEHQLVVKLAQSFWLSQRAIRFQNDCLTHLGNDQQLLALFLRYQTTHDRAYNRALTDLTKLQKERAKQEEKENGFVSQKTMPAPIQSGFVSQNNSEDLALPRKTPSPALNTRKDEAAFLSEQKTQEAQAA